MWRASLSVWLKDTFKLDCIMDGAKNPDVGREGIMRRMIGYALLKVHDDLSR